MEIELGKDFAHELVLDQSIIRDSIAHQGGAIFHSIEP